MMANVSRRTALAGPGSEFRLEQVVGLWLDFEEEPLQHFP